MEKLGTLLGRRSIEIADETQETTRVNTILGFISGSMMTSQEFGVKENDGKMLDIAVKLAIRTYNKPVYRAALVTALMSFSDCPLAATYIETYRDSQQLAKP